MAIEVAGQFFFRFKLGDLEDFIHEDDLIEFTFIEQVGNVLPTFQLTFKTHSDSVLQLLNEANDLQVAFGQTVEELFEASLVTTRFESKKIGRNQRLVSAIGLLSAMDYLANKKIYISPKKSGIEVIKDVITGQRENLRVGGRVGQSDNTTVLIYPDTNLQESSDLQNWIQPNRSDKQYVSDVWMHTSIPNSFVACGISSDAQFIIKDIGSLAGAKNAFDWKFTTTPEDSNDIVYDPDTPELVAQTGFINQWLGYGREYLELSMEAGTSKLISDEARPILALTDQVARRAGQERRFHSTKMRNENVHPEYWSAYLRNLIGLATMGSIVQTVAYSNTFKPTRILDLVMFKDEDISNPNINESASYHTGLYVISKVSRTLMNKQLATTVDICRESLNEVMGTVKESVEAIVQDETVNEG